MKEDAKILLVAFALPILVSIFFTNIINKPQDVVPLFLVPTLLWIGYITGKAGAKVWIITALFITVALAVLYALL